MHDSRGIDRRNRSIGGNDSRWVTSSARPPAHAMQGQGRLSLAPSFPLGRASFSRRRWRRSRGFERDYERGPGAKPRCHNRSRECTNRDGDFTRPPSLSKRLFFLPPNILPPPNQFGILSGQLICLPALLALPYLPEKLEPQSVFWESTVQYAKYHKKRIRRAL